MSLLTNTTNNKSMLCPFRLHRFRSRWAALLLCLVVPHAPLCAQAKAFPESWVGTWRGTLTNYGGADSVKLTVPVVLTIARGNEPGAYRMRHVYNNDTTRGMKDYTLRTVDAAAGRYAAAARTTNGSGPNGERGTPVLSFRVAGRQRSAFVRSGK